jgi:hypothetical protein
MSFSQSRQYSVVCTNHITKAEGDCKGESIIIVLQWMNGLGIPRWVSTHQKLRVTLQAALTWWGGPRGSWQRNGWRQQPSHPHAPPSPFPALIYILATTQTKITGWPFSVNWISRQTHHCYYLYYCRPIFLPCSVHFFWKGNGNKMFHFSWKEKQTFF